MLTEPDAKIASSLLRAASAMALNIKWCHDGATMLAGFDSFRPDLLILAAIVPDITVSTLVEVLRWRWAIPILIGAAKDDDGPARAALAAGATAIIARPYNLEAILPIGLGAAAAAAAPDAPLVAGPILVDSLRHEVRVGRREVVLSPKEFELLCYLIRQQGRVASTDEIATAVWGHTTDTNTVAVHVKRLRSKMGDDPEHGQLIRTVRGVGYRISPSLRGGGPDSAPGMLAGRPPLPRY